MNKHSESTNCQSLSMAIETVAVDTDPGGVAAISARIAEEPAAVKANAQAPAIAPRHDHLMHLPRSCIVSRSVVQRLVDVGCHLLGLALRARSTIGHPVALSGQRGDVT